MLRNFKRLLDDDEAPTTAEYAILIGCLAVVIIGVVLFLGGRVSNMFTGAGEKVTTGP
jgi:Flp pilus assembly pilin Flp